MNHKEQIPARTLLFIGKDDGFGIKEKREKPDELMGAWWN